MSSRAALVTSAFRIALPFGVASTSCWRPVASAALLRQDAEPWLDTGLGATLPPSVSWKISWPPSFGPMPSVPAETNVLAPWVKKSTSVWGLPVAKVFSSSHLAPGRRR